MRPADIRRHGAAADHRVHAQLHRIPPPHSTAVDLLLRANHTGDSQRGHHHRRDSADDRHQHRRPRQVIMNCQPPIDYSGHHKQGHRRRNGAHHPREARRPTWAPASQTVHHRRDTPMRPRSGYFAGNLGWMTLTRCGCLCPPWRLAIGAGNTGPELGGREGALTWGRGRTAQELAVALWLWRSGTLEAVPRRGVTVDPVT